MSAPFNTPLHVEADLTLDIDGQAASLRGNGQRLRFEVERAATLRKFIGVPLPRLGQAGLSLSQIPAALVREGITLEIADKRGPLILMGADVQGASFNIPGVGRLEHVKLAGPGALLRLAFR